MKKYFGDPPNQPDPRPELRSIELLVMTQTVIYERPTWLDEEICEVIYERYLDNKPTLLATTAPEPHLISNHYFQTSVPVCLTK